MSLKQMCHLHFQLELSTTSVDDPCVRLTSSVLGIKNMTLDLSTSEHCVLDLAKVMKGRLTKSPQQQAFAVEELSEEDCAETNGSSAEVLAHVF